MKNFSHELEFYFQAAYRTSRQQDALVYEEFPFREMTMVLYLIDP